MACNKNHVLVFLSCSCDLLNVTPFALYNIPGGCYRIVDEWICANKRPATIATRVKITKSSVSPSIHGQSCRNTGELWHHEGGIVLQCSG